MTVHTESPLTSAHRAAVSWRQRLPAARRERSTRRGVTYFSRSAALYLLLFAGASAAPAWWLRLACLLALPMVIGGLFVIGHDAGHHSLTPSRRLNDLLGRLAMLPALHPYTAWRHAHNTLHHGGTCLKGQHPDFTPLSKREFDALPPWRQRLERFYRTPAGVGVAYVTEFYRRYLLFPSRAHQPVHKTRFHLDRLLVLAFFGLQFAAAYALADRIDPAPLTRVWHAFAVCAVPWAIWIYFMGVASFVQHTHPRTAWYDDAEEWRFYHVQLRSSTHMVLAWPLGAMLHHIMDHPAHHIDPTIPLYELPASQAQLEQESPEESIVVALTVREFLRICRLCKLYDYRRHCWLDFDGRATTASGLHQATAEGGAA
jgi:omega-6 fatty acid desaturase (delta-12 desaturase)